MKNSSNTLLLTRHDGQVRSIEYRPQRTLLMVLGAVIAILGALLYSGFHLGVNLEARSQISDVYDLQALAVIQQNEIDNTRTHAQDSLDALTLRLGRMQAQLLRLESLGQRLVDVADLDTQEFDFNIAPPVGGPENAASLPDNTVPDFITLLDNLDISVQDRERKLAILEQILMHRHVRQRVTPSGRAVEHGLLSSKFGTRIDPFTGKRGTHKGIDIAGKAGSEVLAVGDGVVSFSGARKGYGNLVEVDHGNGYVTRYAHNKQQLVSVGDTVRKEQAIALMGSTGRSTGPHVHIEVLRDGKHVNPAKYLNN